MTPTERAKIAITDWQDAYRKANGKEPPPVSFKNGWVEIHSITSAGIRRRVSDIIRMTGVLRRRANPA